jgi:hypothetical protein
LVEGVHVSKSTQAARAFATAAWSGPSCPGRR